MQKSLLAFLIILLVLSISTSSYSKKGLQGYQLLYIYDDSDVCINRKTDKISIYLLRILINKQKNWLSQDKEIGVLIKTSIGGKSKTGPEKRSFPRMFKTRVDNFDGGLISLGFQLRIFQDFPLEKNGETFHEIDLSFKIMNKKKKANFGMVLEQLNKITKAFPLPPNPYSKGFQFFTEYADTLVDKSLNESNNVDEVLPLGQFSFSFSQGEKCKVSEQTTGAFAIISSYDGNEKEGIVDIGKDYCWKRKTRPTFEIGFARKPPDGNCKNAKPFRKLKNPYMGLFMNAYKPSEIRGGFAPNARMKFLSRCESHGIDPENC